MLSNMACSLIKHKRITTTVAKAKALKKFVEPLIKMCIRDSQKGNAQRGNQLAFGSFGIKALETKWITGRQIEACLLYTSYRSYLNRGR